ncbi:MAG: zinc-ribbon and DUF3426 domain-containing protein [Sheuella sp.]|nr:zinc-ribbon and DUF3426 domain-containing protein [Sheuella sp.]
MSLITRCPKCQNDFLASLDQLRMHEGLVRCGTCSNIFDAYSHLETELPTLTRRASDTAEHVTPAHVTAPGATDPDHGSAFDTITDNLRHPEFQEPVIHYPEPEPAVLRHRTSPTHESTMVSQPVLDEPSISLRGESRSRGADTTSFGRRPPGFLTEAEGPGALVRFFWGALSLLVLLGLLAQGVYIYRNDIATRAPFLQPVLTILCAKLNCDVSLSRHLERISIEASSLQQSAGQTPEGQPVELSLRLTMRNRYDKNQPWPHLSLELKDASGATVVRKTIAPYQYLPPTLVDQPFAAGQEVNLLIPVTVTGLQINGFQLDKFFP